MGARLVGHYTTRQRRGRGRGPDQSLGRT
jgi:hypothetical protein